jgi:hypothetical protein
MLEMLFLGFIALIVVFQLVPAAILFTGMVKGLLPQKSVKELEIK